MIRFIIMLPASFALFLAPLVTMCQHGDDGHVEIIGRCHDQNHAHREVKTHSHCKHGYHGHLNAGPEPTAPVSMTLPHFGHEKIGEADLVRVESRSGFKHLQSGVIAETAFRFEAGPRSSTDDSRGREPQRSPPVILLTRSLLL